MNLDQQIKKALEDRQLFIDGEPYYGNLAVEEWKKQVQRVLVEVSKNNLFKLLT